MSPVQYLNQIIREASARLKKRRNWTTSSASSALTWDIMHPCAPLIKKAIQTNPKDKEAYPREDALDAMKRGTRLKLA